MNNKIYFIDSLYDNYINIFNEINKSSINIVCFNSDFSNSFNSIFLDDDVLCIQFLNNYKLIYYNKIFDKTIFKRKMLKKNTLPPYNLFHNKKNKIIIYNYNLCDFNKIETFINVLNNISNEISFIYNIYLIGNLFGLTNNNMCSLFFSKYFKTKLYYNTILNINLFMKNLKMCKLDKYDIKLIKKHNYYNNLKNFPKLYDDNIIFISCCENNNYNKKKLELLEGDYFIINLLNNTSFVYKLNTKIIFTKDVYNIKKGTIGYIIRQDNDDKIIIKIEDEIIKIKPFYNKIKKIEFLPFIYFWAIKPEHIYLVNKQKNKFIISLSYINKYGYLYHLFSYLNINNNLKFVGCHMLTNIKSIFYQDKINNYKVRENFIKRK